MWEESGHTVKIMCGGSYSMPIVASVRMLDNCFSADFLDNFKDWNIFSKANNVTNNVANTPTIDILNKENQDYYN